VEGLGFAWAKAKLARPSLIGARARTTARRRSAYEIGRGQQENGSPRVAVCHLRWGFATMYEFLDFKLARNNVVDLDGVLEPNFLKETVSF